MGNLILVLVWILPFSGDKDTHRVYKGEWKNEKPNGLGVMTYPDGHKYVGEWKNGKYNGQGTRTFT